MSSTYSTRDEKLQKLEKYFRLVTETISNFQHPVTGLLPASLWKGTDEVCTSSQDAWVRDNVYGILGCWAMSLAYKKFSDLKECSLRCYELEHSTVKLMRSILKCYMKQSSKVAKFQRCPNVCYSLHAKFNIANEEAVVSDDGWGHLQIDATSLFLLMLVQMITSGLKIILTLDEVDFIQNLVFYIENSYRILDYGIWERGDKTNHGFPELNASSIGMAKAALEALSDFNLFGADGGPMSIIHVHHDQINQCKAILSAMLPNESSSKEVGASLLSIIGFPAFVVECSELVSQTQKAIVSKLEGKYGCCRFLRDGHKTVMEDPNRLHYEPSELSIFENIESEWPLFFIYLSLNGYFTTNYHQGDEYFEKLSQVVIKGFKNHEVVPELYYVPFKKVEAEKSAPHSQERLAGNRVPHIWSQSLYIVLCLLKENLITPGDIDPLNRRYSLLPRPELVVQVSLVSRSKNVCEILAKNGLTCQHIPSLRPNVNVYPASLLAHVYTKLGCNERLGFSGRQLQEIRMVGTSKLYQIGSKLYAFTPEFMDRKKFYLCFDQEILVDNFKTEFEYLRVNWKITGRPLMTIPVSADVIGPNGELETNWGLGKLIQTIQSGHFYGIRVHLGTYEELLSTSCVTRLNFITEETVIQLADELDPQLSTAPIRDGVLSNYENINLTKHYPPNDNCTPAKLTSYLSESALITPEDMLNFEIKEDFSSHSFLQFKISSNVNELTKDLAAFMNNSDRGSSSNEQLNKIMDELIKCVSKSRCIHDQAEIIFAIYYIIGDVDFEISHSEKNSKFMLRDCIDDIYNKAGKLHLWDIVRHAAGLLRKKADNLAEAMSDLLVRQKQFTVGPQNIGEVIIQRSATLEELDEIIYNACGKNPIETVLTQELISYLAMLIRTHPRLFEEVIRIRIGLIIQVMMAEFIRCCQKTGAKGEERFLQLSPSSMKALLHHILSGKEFTIRQSTNGIISVTKSSTDHSSTLRSSSLVNSLDLAATMQNTINEVQQFDSNNDRLGLWYRRRILDGSLNRVPPDFFLHIWKILLVCEGISITSANISKVITQEMTPGEWKFALLIESFLNSIAAPHYRQLFVESVVVFSSLIENFVQIRNRHIAAVVPLDAILKSANETFLEDQIQITGEGHPHCCAGKEIANRSCHKSYGGICRFFYDSAPSGRYGTMGFISKMLLSFCRPYMEKDHN